MSGQFTLTEHQWQALFPFHIEVDRELVLRSLGRSLQKLVPTLVTGQPFRERFRLERPATEINSLEQLTALAAFYFILRCDEESIALRGQVIGHADGALLAVSPWINAPEQVQHVRLQLRDFALHDPTPDLLFMMQGTARSLQETRELSRELHQRSQQLQVAMHEARTANMAKSRFLANVSHELRTPMTAILGYADMLHDDLADSRQREFVAVIREQGHRLLSIMDDVLDLSKIESGKFAVQFEHFSLYELLREVESHFRAAVGVKPITLQIQTHANIPAKIHSHRASLMQILKHLLGNAIKFTVQGEIRLVIDLRETTKQRLLQVSVVDPGIGIDLEQRHDLFHAFMQADDSTARSYGGTGLGLTISRRLARMLGGDIQVESQLGQGSTFRVTLDCLTEPTDSKGDATRPPAVAAGSDKSRFAYPTLPYSILVAEDAEINRALLKKLLELVGAQVTFVVNGREAVEHLTGEDFAGQHTAGLYTALPYNSGQHTVAHAASQYDLIIMDIQMPELDGCSATRAIRQAGIETPVIALTANAQDADRVACLAAGCNCFLTKPIDRQTLYTAIEEQVTQDRQRQEDDFAVGLAEGAKTGHGALTKHCGTIYELLSS